MSTQSASSYFFNRDFTGYRTDLKEMYWDGLNRAELARMLNDVTGDEWQDNPDAEFSVAAAEYITELENGGLDTAGRFRRVAVIDIDCPKVCGRALLTFN